MGDLHITSRLDDIEASVGSELDADLAVVDANVDQLLLDVAVVDANVDELLAVSVGQIVVFPTAANPASCTDKNDAGVTPWDNGAWAEIVADSGADSTRLVGMTVSPSAPANYEIDIGVGAGGAEVVIATLPVIGAGYCVVPSCAIQAPTTRYAARIRSAASDGKTIAVKIATQIV